MCGICGIAGRDAPQALEAMVAALRHRGPDGQGRHRDAGAGICLGHTRLAILDRTAAGAQPMASADGQVWITYNGEIYNHLELRQAIAGRHAFAGRSDTETVLAAYLIWGKDCLDRLDGMFAFAIWDGRSGELWLARDRFGVKPLFYSIHAGQLRFASEVRALLADPAWPRAVDIAAVDSFLRLRYVVHPRTLIEGIRSLPGGHHLTWRAGDVRIEPWFRQDWRRRPETSPDQAAGRFAELLSASVRKRLLSDVPVGSYLSGGVDSGLLTALMASMATAPVRTFSIHIPGSDDAPAAAALAAALGTRHTEIAFDPRTFLDLDRHVADMDVPVGDAVIVPTLLLSRAASRQVSVVMTGEGADEILMGYAHQAALARIAAHNGLLRVPGAEGLIARAARLLPLPMVERLFNYGSRLGPAGRARFCELARVIGDAGRRYMTYVSLFSQTDRQSLYRGPLAPFAAPTGPAGFDLACLGDPDIRRGLTQAEFQAWLPDNILQKQDNLSMASGVECREPYLDPRLVDEVMGWDATVSAQLGRNKAVMRRLFADLCPGLPTRPKNAFRLDGDAGIRTMLSIQARETLLDQSAVLAGMLDRTAIRGLLDTLPASPFVRGKQVAALLILEYWLRRHLRGAG
jgi:asparagine synthase (glutamine-hydrolysing)